MRRVSVLLPLLAAAALLVPLELSFALTSGAVDQLHVAWLFPRWLFPLLSADDSYFWDWRCLELLSGAVALLALAFRGSAPWKALFKTLAVASLALIPLPLEVYFFDGGEFYLHFASALSIASLAPLSWFTNADLLGFSLVVLAASAFALTGPGARVGATRRGATLFLAALLAVILLSSLYLSATYVPPTCICQALRQGQFLKP